GKLFGFLAVGERAHHRETERRRGARPQGHIGAVAGSPVFIEKLITADRLDRNGRAGHQLILALRVALPPQEVLVGRESHALARSIDLDPALMAELTLTHHQMAEGEEAAGLALNLDLPLHRGVIAGAHRRDGDRAVAEPVDPATVAQADL